MVAMPVNEWRGGAAIRERRKQKEERQGIRKKGRADSYFSFMCEGLGVTLTLYSQHNSSCVNSSSHALAGLQESRRAESGQSSSAYPFFLTHLGAISRCGLAFPILALSLV